MDRLAALEIFVHVVDTGSFSAVAQSANRSAGGVQSDRPARRVAGSQPAHAFNAQFGPD
jgi:hypothetical protein